MQFYFDLMCEFNCFEQNEEEVLFMGGMYEPQRGEGMEGGHMSRLLWALLIVVLEHSSYLMSLYIFVPPGT